MDVSSVNLRVSNSNDWSWMMGCTDTPVIHLLVSSHICKTSSTMLRTDEAKMSCFQKCCSSPSGGWRRRRRRCSSQLRKDNAPDRTQVKLLFDITRCPTETRAQTWQNQRDTHHLLITACRGLGRKCLYESEATHLCRNWHVEDGCRFPCLMIGNVKRLSLTAGGLFDNWVPGRMSVCRFTVKQVEVPFRFAAAFLQREFGQNEPFQCKDLQAVSFHLFYHQGAQRERTAFILHEWHKPAHTARLTHEEPSPAMNTEKRVAAWVISCRKLTDG